MGTVDKPKVYTQGKWKYSQTQAEKDAQKAYNQTVANKPKAYQSAYQSYINNTLNKIQNYGDFKYNLNGDALYQNYKNQYVALGQQAMQDTIGQASALTGGYGNSYATAAGSQAYQSYLSQLNNVVPELYSMAYDRYNQGKTDLYNQMDMYQNLENTEYGRYRDTVGDWQADRSFNYGAWQDAHANGVNESQFAYQSEVDANKYNYETQYQQYRDYVSDSQWQQNFDYQVQRDNKEDAASMLSLVIENGGVPSVKNLTALGFDEKTAKSFIATLNSNNATEKNAQAVSTCITKISAGIMPSAAELKEAGISKADAQKAVKNFTSSHSSSSSSGGSTRTRTPSTNPQTPQTTSWSDMSTADKNTALDSYLTNGTLPAGASKDDLEAYKTEVTNNWISYVDSNRLSIVNKLSMNHNQLDINGHTVDNVVDYFAYYLALNNVPDAIADAVIAHIQNSQR